MKALVYCLVLTGIVACGPPDSASTGVATDVSAAAGEAVKNISNGEHKSMDVSEEACAMLEDGVVSELFGVNPAQVTYKRSIPVKRAGHVLCSAMWDFDDKTEREAAYNESIQEWGRGKATGKKDPMPKPPRLSANVSITLMNSQFDSAEHAVADLESSVAYLEKGITVTVGGKEYEKKTEFGDWIDGVGDKAIFTDKGELLVAYNGSRFAVNVAVSDDPGMDREQAIVLAGHLMENF